LAFGLAVLQHILEQREHKVTPARPVALDMVGLARTPEGAANPQGEPAAPSLQCLILTPTRELALQVPRVP
jgi:superfamily II DNA/RNA helicase